MSLTTVAAPIQPDESLMLLPASRPERFQRSDFIASGLVFFITLAVYIATLAPSVTLQDSGELITAATKFGVGHAPGYPLWTMSGFLLSHLFPFGNLAWRMNLLCALFGGLSNGVLTLLVCHSGRWLLQRWTDAATQAAVRPFCFYAGILSGLVMGFSDVMWSQAVISAVHGTLNALFMNLVLLFFYLWMLEPKKSHRLILAVFIFALGLSNHHTLVQIIPAFIFAAALLQLLPILLKKPSITRTGTFFSVLLAVNLFSLSILVYISWLSGDEQLQTISQVMAKIILVFTAGVSFFYLKQFRLHLFLLGFFTAVAIFAYGFYLMGPGETDSARYLPGQSHFWHWGSFMHPGWLQGLVANARANGPSVDRHVSAVYGIGMLALAGVALGLLYTSILDRRLIIGIFVVGWIGLMPYSYERIASSTNPPMNWGFASVRSGFYFEVSREQYPKSLPVLIKSTFGKAIGVVPKDAQLDATIGQPNYFPRLGLSFYFYGYSLQNNFTVPLIFLTLAALLYIRRCDWPQAAWFIFLGVAWFLVGFMLQLIAPQEAFDFQHNILYKVFHLQSHCIFALLMGYGALAAMTYLREVLPEYAEGTGVLGFGVPALALSLLPLWSNFDHCSQAGHWFGYNFGADIMRDMDRNAIYYGGSDPGRFVPTFTAFVESQQDNRWKREPGFDRRDVAVITQNALCDTYYTQYIRNQYDDRFRPKPNDYTSFEKWLGRDQAYPKTSVTCMSDDELRDCWTTYQNLPDVRARTAAGGDLLRTGSNDVFDVNGVVAKKMFENNKATHTFYLEQSVPMAWTYPYLLPSGLILKLSSEPVADKDFAARGNIEQDRKFWDAYSQKLLSDPRFRLDDDATLTFGKLAYWHADLYRYRHLEKEEEYWLRMARDLCPQLPDAVIQLAHLLAQQKRFDEALALSKQAQIDDPFNDEFSDLTDWLGKVRMFGHQENELQGKLKKLPYDVGLNLDLAALYQDESKYDDLNDRLRFAAGLTNWTHEAMADVVQYYVDKVHNPDAAIAFLEARAKIDPGESELVYNLAALYATVGQKDNAVKYLTQASHYGGTNALISAGLDPRFSGLRDDPRFQALVRSVPVGAPARVTPATNAVPAVNVINHPVLRQTN